MSGFSRNTRETMQPSAENSPNGFKMFLCERVLNGLICWGWLQWEVCPVVQG